MGDDGSTDGMAGVAQAFARGHVGVLVLRRPDRGRKSSATDFALQYTRAEVVIVVDTDSTLGPVAIWEIVQHCKTPCWGRLRHGGRP